MSTKGGGAGVRPLVIYPLTPCATVLPKMSPQLPAPIGHRSWNESAGAAPNHHKFAKFDFFSILGESCAFFIRLNFLIFFFVCFDFRSPFFGCAKTCSLNAEACRYLVRIQLPTNLCITWRAEFINCDLLR